MPKKKQKVGKPEVHKDLKGFEISINNFGQMESSLSLDKLNAFLDKNVEDKKLKDRETQNENVAADEDNTAKKTPKIAQTQSPSAAKKKKNG